MNKERIRLWVDALESGDYEQGYRYLQGIPSKYCCLGVACDVAIKNGLELDVTRELRDQGTYYDEYNVILPDAVVDWFGLDSRDPYITSQSSLTDMNDSGQTFVQIAKAIRQEFLND